MTMAELEAERDAVWGRLDRNQKVLAGMFLFAAARGFTDLSSQEAKDLWKSIING